MNTDSSKTHVVIVGGGFAGLACARRLAKSDEVRVTLIDKNNFHQFQPLLYQLATSELGTGDVATSLRQALCGHANADVKMEEVTATDPKARSVTTRQGRCYQGDFLVLAAGSQANFFSTPGAKENAFPLYALEDAQRLRSRILTVFEDADRDPKLIERGALNFVIVGGGPTGTEMAGALADMIRGAMVNEYPDLPVKRAQVYLVEHGDALLAPFSEKAHAYAARTLRRKGVDIRLRISVKEVAPDHVSLSDGTTSQTRTVVWAGGLTASPLAANAGLPRGHGGRIEVRPDLTVEGFPGVYALGDFANISGPSGGSLPQLASVAQQCGDWTAKNILAGSRKRADSISISRQRNYGDDRTRRGDRRDRQETPRTRGPIAFAAWLGVHALLMSGVRQRVEAFVNWAWTYFSRSQPIQVLDRSDVQRIDWGEGTEVGDSSTAPAVKTAR